MRLMTLAVGIVGPVGEWAAQTETFFGKWSREMGGVIYSHHAATARPSSARSVSPSFCGA
jgi:hypothetical protein